VGYGGRRSTEMIDALRVEGVDLLVDVRLTPRSGIPGFSGYALQRSLSAVGIEYRHEAALGNPADNRAGYHEGEPSSRRRFRRLLKTSGQGALSWLVEAASRQRVAVLCAERDQTRCHRHEILAAACQLKPGLVITNLG
jgi:uncharacterized protein (DUF488 family)